MSFDRSDLEAAAQSNSPLRRVLDRLIDKFDGLENAIGVSPELTPPNRAPELFAPPPQSTWYIDAHDGAFQIFITNHADVRGVPLVHQLQSSETVPFESSTTAYDYGQTSQNIITLVTPGATLFWRLRSKLPMGQWNAFQILGPYTSS